jgi:propionate catabolism operon transcriptional regulator
MFLALHPRMGLKHNRSVPYDLQNSCLHQRYSFKDIVGSSVLLQNVITMAKVFAETASPVFISGETGTGKELFAQSIHSYSSRASHPFVAVNCASLSATLLESELFGYNDGAFTGASKGGKAGIFELAHRGTVFLDEIGDISSYMQVKLLRVLQEKQIRRIGAGEDIPVDIRIIAATNRNIEEMVALGRFRKDLYYRLNVLRLDLPSLRDRLEDIPELVSATCKKYHLESDSQSISGEILFSYAGYEWPGNVRELENIVQRISVMKKFRRHDTPYMPNSGDTAAQEAALSGVRGQHLCLPIYCPFPNPGGRQGVFTLPFRDAGEARKNVSPRSAKAWEPEDYRNFCKKNEREYFYNVVRRFQGNKTKAAAYLGISRTTLWAKLKQ